VAKKYLLLLLFSLAVVFSFGQHCPWDGSSFIMLDIKNNPSIQLQKIYLLDSVSRIVTSKHYFGNRVEEDTVRFWKNPPGDAMRNPAGYDKQYFSFAKDYQVVEFGQYKQGMAYRVLVIYSFGDKMLRKEISLPKNAVHQLCTLNKNLWGGNEKPVEFTL
jgi:hypothetical protein